MLTVVCTTVLLLVISPYNVTPPALGNGTANTILRTSPGDENRPEAGPQSN